ncbi:hypothetical protein MSAN_01170100 [Mycena sanguinolenta]|uniref:Uncharacterized protein n=1 Tax=Mycena sanguinolenta TaxID=230812 RepID=A0A8H6YK62_9AGAR|nr:hypothetical protein MSAN_01170100 [Mycena sanguinolenta]
MSKGFPWTVFSANTLRPMVSDIVRFGGYPSSQYRLNKEESLTLLENIEKHGLEVALKELKPAIDGPAAKTSIGKRKHPEEEEASDLDIGESISRPLRKRGRPQKASQSNDNAILETVSAPAATRSRRNPDVGPGEGLTTRRQAAQAQAEKVPATRSSKPLAQAPRKTAPAAKKTQPRGNKRTVSHTNAKPTSTGKKFFDGVEIMKRPQSQVGKGKGKEREMRDDQAELDACSDTDAEGEVEVDDKMEVEETASSILENSNKENISLTDIANADTDVDAEGEEVLLPQGDEVPLPGGQEVSIPDGQEVSIPDGQEVPISDGQEVSIPDGQEVSIPDGQEVSIPDGQEVSIPDGQEVSIPDGQEVSIPDGQEVSIPDGQEVSISDGQEVSLLDGQGVPRPDGEEVPLPDGEEVSLHESEALEIGSPAPEMAIDEILLRESEVREIGSPAPEITVDGIEAARPKGQDALIPDVPEIGSPAPQIAIEPTDDQIEEARLNHDVMAFDIGSPAPEISIEPMAEDDGEEIQFEPMDGVTVVQVEGNGHTEEGGFLHARPRPRLEIQRAGTPLNPEYSIEVFSPGSVQHDSDDEMWVTRGINGTSLQAAGGGLNALDW